MPISSNLQPSGPSTTTTAPAQTAESITVSVSLANASVEAGQSQTFTATVSNDPKNQGVVWVLSGACSGASCGALSANSSGSGVAITYTGPATVPNPPNIRLIATSVSDATRSATAAITIFPGSQGTGPLTVSVSPASVSVYPAKSQNFTATVVNDSQNQGVHWSLSGAGCSGANCGTLSSTSSASGASITYTAPKHAPNPPSVTLTATPVTNNSVSATAAITVAAPISVSITPTSKTVETKDTQSFTATVQNDLANAGVTWTLSGAGCSGSTCGTLSSTSSASGTAITYTAPTSVPKPATVKLTATSVSDDSKSASATITIAAPPPAIIVSVSPASQAVLVSNTQRFTATVQHDSANKGVTWKLSGAGCSGSACGTLSSSSSASGASIIYTAPTNVPNPATVTLTATSVSDSSSSTSAQITVYSNNSNNNGVTVLPKRGGLTVSQTVKFTAVVSGSGQNQGVTWSASGGTFTSTTTTTAAYQAPNTAGVYVITATSIADVTKSGTAVIGVTDLPGVMTYHNDGARDGVNSREFALTTSNVSKGTFGKLFSCAVDAAVYPQTLWVANLAIGGGTHNVIFTATSNDTVYAFDADANPCVTYWSKNLIPSGETVPTGSNIGGDDIEPIVGIVGTPVIDPVGQVLYVVTKTKTQGTNCRTPGSCHQRLHALNIVDGSETANGPTELTSAITVPGTGDGSSNGRLPFNPLHENQRPGLALVNGVIYVCWASHYDQSPWHGWIMGFNKSNLRASPTLYVTSPNGKGGGIWMGGGAPAIDENNNLYVITGNGDYDGKNDFGDSVLKLSADLSLQDWLTPFDQASMDSGNGDFGAGGAAILANLPSGPVPHLVIGGGKVGSGYEGELYVVNRDAMGHLEGTGSPVVQKFPVGEYVFATGAFWQNSFFIAGSGGPLKAFALNPSTSHFDTNPSISSARFPGRGATPSVSSNGTSEGIVWAVDTSQYGPPSRFGTGPAVLHAFDATNLGNELWNSSQTSGDQAGNAVKFTVPTIANGKVYIGTTSEIEVYGLVPN